MMENVVYSDVLIVLVRGENVRYLMCGILII